MARFHGRLPCREASNRKPAKDRSTVNQRTAFQRYHRGFLVVCWAGLLPFGLRADEPASGPKLSRTPVIVDTDIGDDTDDGWALVFALKNPGLDVKLVTTTYGKASYRGALIAKFLTVAGRTDIPVGLGPGPDDGKRRMQNWLGDFTLARYAGKVREDGVQALIDTVNSSPAPVTIIGLGPLNTIAAALRKDPGIAAHANFVAMLGSIRVGYGGSKGPAVEYNVWSDRDDARQVLSAPWRSISLAPLDTGGSIHLSGARYQALLDRGDPLIRALLANNALADGAVDSSKIHFSGSGFDLVGVFLAEDQPSRLAGIEKLKIIVDEQGKTVVSSSGAEANVATSWRDQEGFLDHLVTIYLLPIATTSGAASSANPSPRR